MKIGEIISDTTKDKIYKSTNKHKVKAKNKVKAKDNKRKENFSEKDIMELMGQHYYRRGPNGSIRQVK